MGVGVDCFDVFGCKLFVCFFVEVWGIGVVFGVVGVFVVLVGVDDDDVIGLDVGGSVL